MSVLVRKENHRTHGRRMDEHARPRNSPSPGSRPASTRPRRSRRGGGAACRSIIRLSGRAREPTSVFFCYSARNRPWSFRTERDGEGGDATRRARSPNASSRWPGAWDEAGSPAGRVSARGRPLGLLRPGLVSEEFGGMGLDVLSYAVAMEELARANASYQGCLSVHNSLVPLHGRSPRFGTPEQRNTLSAETGLRRDDRRVQPVGARGRERRRLHRRVGRSRRRRIFARRREMLG